MAKKKLSRGQKKYIRREKSKIREQVADPQQLKQQIEELYKKLLS